MLHRLKARHPALLALLVQLLGALLLLVLSYALAWLFGWHLSLLGAGMLLGLIAALLGQWLGLSRWWLPINLLFVPGLLWLQGYGAPSWLYLGVFVLLALLNWNSLRERVPLYLTGRKTSEQLAQLLGERTQPLRFIDLGSGLAAPLLRLARRFPDSRFEGVETAPLVFVLSWLRALPQPNCQIRYRSLWQVELADYDVVYCFLSPAPMAALWQKARAQMRPGSWLISNSFAIPEVEPARRIDMHDWRQSSLLLWTL